MRLCNTTKQEKIWKLPDRQDSDKTGPRRETKATEGSKQYSVETPEKLSEKGAGV
jgi:hypothetical protein